MTLPPVSRIFFAIEPHEALKAEISQLISSLKKRLKSNAIRWSRIENLHLTLQFLASVETQHVPQLIENVRTAMQKTTLTPTLYFEQIQLFPNAYHPRVVVLGAKPEAPLLALSSMIAEGIKASRYAVEERPYRPHVTLGRIKQVGRIPPQALLNAPFEITETMQVREVVLFRSEPHPEGTTYSALERIALQVPATEWSKKAMSK